MGALRVQSDMSVFYNYQMDGYQDTLYAHAHRQFYRDCTISGTIDFIFGNAAVVFQNCNMIVRKPLDMQQCIVTAQGRIERREPTGIVLEGCKITADPAYYPVRDLNKAYLGRPWKQFSRTIIMQTDIGNFIQPEGWLPWMGNFLSTLASRLSTPTRVLVQSRPTESHGVASSLSLLPTMLRNSLRRSSLVAISGSSPPGCPTFLA